MASKVSDIYSQILYRDYATKKKLIFHLKSSEIICSDSDTQTEGSADNES